GSRRSRARQTGEWCARRFVHCSPGSAVSWFSLRQTCSRELRLFSSFVDLRRVSLPCTTSRIFSLLFCLLVRRLCFSSAGTTIPQVANTEIADRERHRPDAEAAQDGSNETAFRDPGHGRD